MSVSRCALARRDTDAWARHSRAICDEPGCRKSKHSFGLHRKVSDFFENMVKVKTMGSDLRKGLV